MGKSWKCSSKLETFSFSWNQSSFIAVARGTMQNGKKKRLLYLHFIIYPAKFVWLRRTAAQTFWVSGETELFHHIWSHTDLIYCWMMKADDDALITSPTKINMLLLLDSWRGTMRKSSFIESLFPFFCNIIMLVASDPLENALWSSSSVQHKGREPLD